MKNNENETKRNWVRNCPECNKDIIHKDKYACIKGIKQNKLCGFCSRSKVGKENKGNIRSQESKDKTSKKLKGHPSLKGNKERGDKIKQKLLGRDVSSWYNRKSYVIKNCLVCNNEINVQQYRLNTNHFCSRECQINYYHDSKIWKPRFNPKACEVIEEYGKQNGYNFQHALNEGEFKVKDLRYFVDGYDKEKNVVIEYNEKYHDSPSQKELDIKRRENIIKTLKCKFIVLYYDNKIEIYE